VTRPWSTSAAATNHGSARIRRPAGGLRTPTRRRLARNAVYVGARLRTEGRLCRIWVPTGYEFQHHLIQRLARLCQCGASIRQRVKMIDERKISQSLSRAASFETEGMAVLDVKDNRKRLSNGFSVHISRFRRELWQRQSRHSLVSCRTSDGVRGG